MGGRHSPDRPLRWECMRLSPRGEVCNGGANQRSDNPVGNSATGAPGVVFCKCAEAVAPRTWARGSDEENDRRTDGDIVVAVGERP